MTLLDPPDCDAIVVGAGPIGIETAVALAAAGVQCRVIEAGPIGNTISWWAPQTRWFSSNDRIAICGVPLNTIDQAKASREEYLNYLRTVVDQFQVPITAFTRVVSIEKTEDEQWLVGIASGTSSERSHQLTQELVGQIRTSYVILATGGTDIANQLGVPGEDLPMVDGYLRETHRYHGRRVLIVGGRNSAVEAAIRLHRVGASVTLSYHRDALPSDSIKYWLQPEIDGLIRSGAIKAVFDSEVVAIEPGNVTLQRSNAGKLKSGPLEELINIAVDDVLTLIGYRQDKTLFRKLGIPLESEGELPVFDPHTMETPVSGIYVAGTAIGGTQSSKYQTFLENCHDHPVKIARHIRGRQVGRRQGETRGGELDEETLKSENEASLSRRIEWSPES